jgi:hypothetical protein
LRRFAQTAAALGLGLALLSTSGCYTMLRGVEEKAPSTESIRGLTVGAPVAEVLEQLGVPNETWAQPDGLLLVYRQRFYDYDRVGIDPSSTLRFIDVSQTTSGLLENLSLTLEWGRLTENRLALLFDPEQRLVTWAWRGRDGTRTP